MSDVKKLVPQIRICIKYFLERFEKGKVFGSLEILPLEALQKNTFKVSKRFFKV